MYNIWLAFLTGLTTGGLSCLAVQGGLVTSATTQPGANSSKTKTVGVFLLAKLFAHTILGFLLGGLGSYLVLSVRVQGWLQILAGLFMLATVGRMLNLHPIFRYLVIQPPTWAYKYMRRISRDPSFFAPVTLGLLTILIPCGVTQTMMVLAISSGSPWLGSGILAAFVLGTSPIFLALGLTTAKLMQYRYFEYAAATLIAVFAVLSINGGVALTGSVYTLQNFYKAAALSFKPDSVKSVGAVAGAIKNGKQEVNITVKNNSYVADSTTLRVGIPVKLNLLTNSTQGCTRVFTISSLNISKVLPETGTETVEFTPTKTGRLSYACGMGMFTGSFNII